MITAFDQLTVATNVYQPRTYSGIVTFTVTAKSPTMVELKSVSISGFDMELSKEDVESIIAGQRPLYTSFDEAIDCENEKDNQRTAEYVATYESDIDNFVLDMIRTAYSSQRDPEYGDDVRADAIKHIADQYFPDSNLY